MATEEKNVLEMELYNRYRAVSCVELEMRLNFTYKTGDQLDPESRLMIMRILHAKSATTGHGTLSLRSRPGGIRASVVDHRAD